MSTPTPPPRRRRIAGERRPAGTMTTAAPTVPTGSAVTPAPPVEAPARPRRERAPRAPRTSRAPRAHRSPARPRDRRLAIGLAALLVVLLTYTGLLLAGVLGTVGLSDLDRAEEQAAAARASQASAERAAEAALAYDYRSLEEDRDAAARFMTPDYAEEYVATFDTGVLRAAQDAKAQVSVEVLGSGVVSADADRAKVLLFVDQTTVTADQDQPRVALNRVELLMEKQGGTWLVADISSF